MFARAKELTISTSIKALTSVRLQSDYDDKHNYPYFKNKHVI